MTKRKTPSAPDRDNPQFTQADLARAKRVEDIPALAHLSKRKRGERGPQKSPKKTPVAIRLDADVVAHYRGKGPGWQSRINADLRAAAKLAHR